MRSGIKDEYAGGDVARVGDHLCETGGLYRFDVGQGCCPHVVPLGSRSLRVEVENEDVLPVLPERSREMQGDRRFSAATLLVHKCDCLHGPPSTGSHVHM